MIARLQQQVHPAPAIGLFLFFRKIKGVGGVYSAISRFASKQVIKK
jgi:hypothetical protein